MMQPRLGSHVTLVGLLLVALLASLLSVAPPTALATTRTITQWNFNGLSNTEHNDAPPASIGIGTAILIGGVTSTGFNSGNGSSDPTASDNLGWQTLTYAEQGLENEQRGVQFSVSTVGYEAISPATL
ncbi:hypothetical protein [Candidatus Viridilinea mediisalina]|uniref:PEP-CTERM sorting domain-containing protein n=1 Tax=Candidatus Viridilinea mediisalina TaxID=2024553 RepID=A0A2A6RG32_9CHLR|nr:hypothetical protein [Candidatus Viridilinea mediisalina]PDW01839.1 hypothetical protein CJ255_17025 [Candidatus Viridilinea mediisalina]